MNKYYFDCQCSDFNHIFRITHDTDDNYIYLETLLNIWLPWYKRIWIALKYMLGIVPAYGHYAETLIREEDLVKLQQIINDYYRKKSS